MPRAWLLCLLLAAGCTTSVSPSPTADIEGVSGGTLRVGIDVPNDADPALEQWLLDPQRFFWHPLSRCCLLRTLPAYDGRPIEDGGLRCGRISRSRCPRSATMD